MKALVFDLDDTLLNHHKKISKLNEDALFTCIEQGIEIIIATSRPMRAIRQFLTKEQLAKFIVISLNGAVIHMHGEVVKCSSLQGNGRNIIERACAIEGAIVSIEFEGESFSTNKKFSAEGLFEYQNATEDMLIAMDDVNEAEISKVAIDGCGKNLTEFGESIQDPAIKTIYAVNETFINVVAAGVDKSTALGLVAQKLNIQLDDIAAFGDDIPDIEMMASVGLSVAMGNADERVKLIADHVIGDCSTDTIADFIMGSILRCERVW